MSPIVPTERLADVWPEVLPWITDAVDRNQGDENIWDVFVAIAQGRYWLWHNPGKYAAVVQVMRYPRQVVATVLYAGGSDLEAMKETLEFGKQWCKQNGIGVIRVWGRRGWERVMGLQHKGSIMQVAVQ